MVRLFVALPLPDPVCHRLAMMSGGIPGARWTASENFHLTLRFIGEVDGHVYDDVVAALGQVRAPGFDLSLAGIDQFGKGEKARTLWIGVDKNPALTHLRDRVESVLARTGLPHEQRKFTPHVTLARLHSVAGGRLGGFFQDHAMARIGPIAIDRFTLFSSWPGEDAPLYEIEVEYPLAAAVSPAAG